jgi:phosphatidylglycerol---prolipoprotein diacylglyceryl transferase
MKINLDPQLIHLYGPFGIHSYGLFIALGIVISVLAARRNKRFAQLHLEPVFLDIITVTVIIGCIAGRALSVISEPHLYPHWQDWFALWQGGFSALGSIIGIITLMPLYLKKINVPLLPLFDLAAIYAPLMQSIGRLGCFAAGCCYGIATTAACGVIYTNPHSLATCGITIHPTQLYSSVLLFGIFLFMFLFAQHHVKKNGQLFAIYLTLAATERFVVDFWRADRIMITNYLSFHQIVALCITLSIAVVTTIMTLINTNNKSSR